MVISAGEFHKKGGDDIPVADGGTNASVAATALSNLGHGSTAHAGISGVGNLHSTSGLAGTVNHATLSHTGIPGVGVTSSDIVFGFGANLTTSGAWARVNGEGDSAELAGAGSRPEASVIVPKASTSITVTWNVTSTGGSIRVFKNGPVAKIISLSTTTGVVVDGTITFSQGDWLALGLSGTAAGIGTYQVMLSS